jgi:DNA sulfur modification protein DndE
MQAMGGYMLPKRLRISQSATDTLKLLKARTGLTPNIVCRIALILSLENGPTGGLRATDQVGSDFNSSTLFGEFEVMFDTLILDVHGYLNAKDKTDAIVSHIDDGLSQLRKSKTLKELIEHCGSARNPTSETSEVCA